MDKHEIFDNPGGRGNTEFLVWKLMLLVSYRFGGLNDIPSHMQRWLGACYFVQYHELAAEAFYLMAMVYDKLGNLEEREKAAASFKEHTLALRNPQESVDDILNTI